MKSINKRAPLLAACAFAAATLLGNAAMANPAGITYAVHVRTSFGTTFKDCFAFDSDSTLTIAGLGAITYDNGSSFGPGKNSFFDSVAPQSLVDELGDSFAFSGYGFTFGKKGGTGYLKAIGISGSGAHYVINGQPDMTCTTTSSTGTSPYLPPK